MGITARDNCRLSRSVGPSNGAEVAGCAATPALHTLTGWADLDTGIGLRNLNGKVDRYLAMLARLAISHGSDAEAVRQAWAVRDCAEVRRLAHALRGIASTLGAVRVSVAAERLDRPALAELDGEDIDERVAGLEDAVQGLIRGLFERASIGRGTPSTLCGGRESGHAG